MAIFHYLKLWGETEINLKNINKHAPIFLLIFLLSLSLGILFTLCINIKTLSNFSNFQNKQIDKEKVIENLKKIDRERLPITTSQ